MAPILKNKSKSKKNVKKSFYTVEAPITATKIQLYSTSAEDLNNRTVKIDLTKSLRGKSLVLKLRIKESNGKLTASPESLELLNSYIRRVMRRGTDYVEDSFETECKDHLVKIKPFMITRRRVSKAVLKALRETANKNVKSYAKARTAEEIISDIITNKLQKTIIPKLKKVYPLALCEIRMFSILKPLEKESDSKKEE
jgi:ribosomal protein S3AE